jgi:hypothetical protein
MYNLEGAGCEGNTSMSGAETFIEYIEYSFYFEKVLEHNPSFLSLQGVERR